MTPSANPPLHVPGRGYAMAAKIIDGKQVAAGIRAACKERVAELAARGVVPGLAVVLVGDDPASAVYVRNKIRACADVGIRSFRYDFPADVDADRVIATIEELNRRGDVHGILVQLPLPPQSRRHAACCGPSPPTRMSTASTSTMSAAWSSATPSSRRARPTACMKLLEHEGIELEGKNVVVVGASNIVGKPMALMLMQRDATVCICHAKTRDLDAVHDPGRHPGRGGRFAQSHPAANGADRRRRDRRRHQSLVDGQAGRRRRLRGRRARRPRTSRRFPAASGR